MTIEHDTEQNKAVVRNFLEGLWNYEKLQSLPEVLAPDYVFHDAIGDTHGIRQFREAIAEELEAFAELLVVVDDLVGEGDRVAVRYTSSYVHHGEFMRAFPTGQLMKLRGMSFHRVAGCKVAETWEAYDRRTRTRDLGAEQRLSDPDEAAIHEVIDQALAIGFSDRPALAKLYYADCAEIVAANGDVIRGRRAIIDWFERFPPVSDWRMFDLQIDGAGELAWVRGRYTMTLSPRAKLPFDKGQYLEIWRKQSDGRWQAVRKVFTSEIASRTRNRTPLAHAL